MIEINTILRRLGVMFFLAQITATGCTLDSKGLHPGCATDEMQLVGCWTRWADSHPTHSLGEMIITAEDAGVVEGTGRGLFQPWGIGGYGRSEHHWVFHGTVTCWEGEPEIASLLITFTERLSGKPVSMTYETYAGGERARIVVDGEEWGGFNDGDMVVYRCW